MHESSLFGQVPEESHHVLLQQLAGMTRMQPRHVVERHLVFKAIPPPGLAKIQSGATQGIQPPEVQKTKAFLGNPQYHLQLVTEASPNRSAVAQDANVASVSSSRSNEADTLNGKTESKLTAESTLSEPDRWSLEFRDIPEAVKNPLVTSRLMSRNPIEGGDVFKFMRDLGYEYVMEYVSEGDKFYDYDITIFVYRMLEIPSQASPSAGPRPSMEPLPWASLTLLDKSGTYVVQASAEIEDGSKPALMDRAAQQLLRLKESLKYSVVLAPGDRNALDTKVKTRPGVVMAR